MCTGCLTFYTGVDQDPLEMYGKTNQKDYSCIASGPSTSSDPVWVPPDSIKYREIKGVCVVLHSGPENLKKSRQKNT